MVILFGVLLVICVFAIIIALEADLNRKNRLNRIAWFVALVSFVGAVVSIFMAAAFKAI